MKSCQFWFLTTSTAQVLDEDDPDTHPNAEQNKSTASAVSFKDRLGATIISIANGTNARKRVSRNG